jgi:ribonuclease VapC
MVIDSSAILAILQDARERQSFNQTIAAASERHLSAASLVEIAIVVEARFGAHGQRNLDLFLATAAIGRRPL